MALISSTLKAIYRLAFECSPIVLTGGLADGVVGGVIPIITLLESSSLLTSIIGGTDITDLSTVLCHFSPASGGTLINQEIGHYPFPNQTTAANAVISQPLNISLIMQCPINSDKGAFTKFATLTSLQNTLTLHNSSGGLYNILTPSFIYENCLLTGIRDISPSLSAGGQTQTVWQWDFEKPLITDDDADDESALMSAVASGTTISSAELSWSSILSTSVTSYTEAYSSVLSALGV